MSDGCIARYAGCSRLTSQSLRVEGYCLPEFRRRYHARLRLIDDSSIGLIDDIGYNLPCSRRRKLIRLLRVHTYVSLKINGTACPRGNPYRNDTRAKFMDNNRNCIFRVSQDERAVDERMQL